MLSVSYAILRVNRRWFTPDRYVFRTRAWESNGKVYTGLFLVKKWKGLLPDGAAWFTGGFAKKHLRSRDPGYFEQFVRETCRGEAAHWISLAFVPLFFVYNPLWAAAVMMCAGALLNVPCIITQRFNRIQLMRLVQMTSQGTRSSLRRERRSAGRGMKCFL